MLVLSGGSQTIKAEFAGLSGQIETLCYMYIYHVQLHSQSNGVSVPLVSVLGQWTLLVMFINSENNVMLPS